MSALTIPQLSLVVLVGASGSGKSTFARANFLPTEVLSSDACRGLVADDENDQSATDDAFDVLHYVAAKRLAAGRLTVVDATNVQEEARRPLVELARRYHVLPVAIVLNVPEAVCHERNATRPERSFGPHVVRRQSRDLRRSLRALRREGFRHVHVLSSVEEVAAATVERQRLWNDRREDRGPFDLIGDVHGCLEELDALLDELGWTPPAAESGARSHPDGRRAIFLGDLVDRGPDTPGVLRRAMAMVEAGTALAVPGNHDIRLVRKLRGRDVRVTHGLAESLEQLEREDHDFGVQAASFLDGLVSHYVLDGGGLVVAHAGQREEMQGRGSGRVREFALYGETTGETDEFGLPVRYDWASEYRGRATVVYGHTPVPEAEWLNRTINIDTGCVFGGRLTALRWPERELVSVPAVRVHADPIRPLVPVPADAPTAQQLHDELLDLDELLGKRLVGTRLFHTVTVREANAAAALEVMSRFAVDPRWLVHLPPTMSPTASSSEPGLLEHPAEAFAYFAEEGVARDVCEEKHMGSRAIVVACRDAEAARARFGVGDGAAGVCFTRTGRPFFDDPALAGALLERLREAVGAAGLWDELTTDWLVLDCELMPWSVKAQGLLRGQYAAVAAAARAALPPAVDVVARTAARGLDVDGLDAKLAERSASAERYAEAYGRYCWPVASLDDLRLAPFSVLASEGAVHVERDHLWHLDVAARLGAAGGRLFQPTRHLVVETGDPASVQAGLAFWLELTGAGGEGMVVKPLEPVVRGPRGLVQPAVKCRGPEYLRIIYGPDYDAPGNLERLRRRSVGAKRGLALREFALGVEGLERFVRREPLRAVHECAFAVLALESEPVDPRL
jgi:protein phosphatase